MYRGHILGLQQGVVHGVVPGTAWTSSGSEEQAAFLVSKASKPLPGCAPTDFGFVPDPRVFHVDVAGKIESVPVHLLFGGGDASQ